MEYHPVAIAVEGRGRRLTVADWLSPDEIEAAKKACSSIYVANGRRVT